MKFKIFKESINTDKNIKGILFTLPIALVREHGLKDFAEIDGRSFFVIHYPEKRAEDPQAICIFADSSKSVLFHYTLEDEIRKTFHLTPVATSAFEAWMVGDIAYLAVTFSSIRQLGLNERECYELIDTLSETIKDFYKPDELSLNLRESFTEALTPSDKVFDTSYQDSYYYDSFIKNPTREDNKIFSIEYLSPKEYFQECADNIFHTPVDHQLRQIKADVVVLKRLDDAVERGEQLPLTILDYTVPTQEGRHRMYVVGEKYGWNKKFPVGVLRWVDEEAAAEAAAQKHIEWVTSRVDDDIDSLRMWHYDTLEEFEEQVNEWTIPRWERRFDFKSSLVDEGDYYTLDVDGVGYEFRKDELDVGPADQTPASDQDENIEDTLDLADILDLEDLE